MTRLWSWIVANPELTVFILQQVVFAGGSAICQTMGWTRMSKVFGTLTTLDVGRVLRAKGKTATSSEVKP